MNQGENTDTISTLDRSSTEKVEEPESINAQDTVLASFVPSTSNSGATVGAQGYSGHNAYQNTDAYSYSSTGYATYYNGYQQQPNQYQMQPIQYQQQTNQFLQPQSSQYQPQSSQLQQQSGQYQPQSSQYHQHSNQSYLNHAVAYHNTGAPYEPLSSFQNSGPYSVPTSYSTTYYNPGDYQTSGNYMSGTYAGSANSWHGQPYAYNSHQYPNYTTDSNSTYSSSMSSATLNHNNQYYKQWENYYSQSQTEVSCAPGTEKLTASSASATSSILNTNSGYSVSNNHVPAAHAPSWQPASSSSEATTLQPVEASGSNPEGHRKHGTSAFQKDQYYPMQPHAQKPPDTVLIYESSQKELNSAFSQGPTTSYSSYQASQSNHTSPPPVPQPLEDAQRVSKMQIPNNPRIPSNFPVGVPKSNKDIATPAAVAKPAYISVPLQMPDDKVPTHDVTGSLLKHGMFPKSLRGYVERALARCKDDKQKKACQTLMKELITQATADGTLYTRDWDTEPLISLPSGDAVNKEVSEFAIPGAAVPGSKISHARRAKSRWEPVPGDSLTQNFNLSNKTPKCADWNKQFKGHKLETKEDNLGTTFSLSFPKVSSINVMRPAKRQRVGGDLNSADDHDDSSSSDEDHSLTKYSAAAVALADSPAEMKKRENRSKRFENKRKNRAKNGESGNMYARRAKALVLSRNAEESGSRAVEDIDWDAFTVKGTCQEIEKRYLRLTSAPDPATVRPEEVLEKALLMVQDSKKNYLYKCDQLKSIRQDLTVQRIRNELTVKVYETHARLSIEFGDLPEYNQCQSQLKVLYAEGIKGCHMEFAAYSLLCATLHSNNKREFLSAMSRLSAEAKKDEAVKHALLVRAAVTSGNYVMFFRLYNTAPNISTYFMDLFVEKMRYAAVKCISRSYRPTVPISYLSQILGFSSALSVTDASDVKETGSIEECIEWLKAHGACLQTENSGEVLLDAKASVSSLYMPEPDDAVAHGDTNLAVNDFFTRNLT